jgi:Bacterial Ig domain
MPRNKSITKATDDGKVIPGVLTGDNKVWKPTGPLGYGRTYTMTIAAHGPGGMPSRQTSSFTTVTPDYQTEVYLDTVGPNPGRGHVRRRHHGPARDGIAQEHGVEIEELATQGRDAMAANAISRMKATTP